MKQKFSKDINSLASKVDKLNVKILEVNTLGSHLKSNSRGLRVFLSRSSGTLLPYY